MFLQRKSYGDNAEDNSPGKFLTQAKLDIKYNRSSALLLSMLFCQLEDMRYGSGYFADI